uniref:Leucyl/phenylalanyl-tRNA protein transferase n=1 Tax=Trypanosoma congolense (strain IL3000) TaxID=1068625 RepID=G0UVG3_TRYCI|nr:conserved hypothetical protein [Trypanosoma congolense IL3000]
MKHTTQHYRTRCVKVFPRLESIAREVEEVYGQEDVRIVTPLAPRYVEALSASVPQLDGVSDVDSFLLRMLTDPENRELGFSVLFSPELIDESCQKGLFPLACKVLHEYIYAPKLHVQRCLVWLKPEVCGLSVNNSGEGTLNIEKFHVSKKYLRGRCDKARGVSFDVFVNREEDVVPILSLIHAQHGENWFCRSMRACFVYMFMNSGRYRTKVVFTAVRRHRYDVDSGTEKSSEPPSLADRTDGECIAEGDLVAAEVGFLVGDIYSSATGAYCASGAGTAQLAVVAEIMRAVGCSVWDLGMNLPYKKEVLGCVSLPRAQWLQLVSERANDRSVSEAIDGQLRERYSSGVSLRSLLK